MSTFWERATGIGLQDQEELLNLNDFETTLASVGFQVSTMAQLRTKLALTQEQGEELDHYLQIVGFGGARGDILFYVQNLALTLRGARLGLPALNSIQDVQQSLQYFV